MKNVARGMMANVAQALASRSKIAAIALPDSKGNETPKQLQTNRAEIYTYFTVANGESMLMYSAESFVKLKVSLETAGPVAIGTAANLSPVLGGRGRQLDVDEEYEVILSKGDRVYIISETVNRIGVTIEPIPWMGQIAGEIAQGQSLVRTAIAQGVQSIVHAIMALRDNAPPTSSRGTPANKLEIPPPGFVARPRLTPMLKPRKAR